VKRGGGQRGRQPAYNKTAHMTRVAKQLQKGVGLKGGFWSCECGAIFIDCIDFSARFVAFQPTDIVTLPSPWNYLKWPHYIGLVQESINYL